MAFAPSGNHRLDRFRICIFRTRRRPIELAGEEGTVAAERFEFLVRFRPLPECLRDWADDAEMEFLMFPDEAIPTEEEEAPR